MHSTLLTITLLNIHCCDDVHGNIENIVIIIIMILMPTLMIIVMVIEDNADSWDF